MPINDQLFNIRPETSQDKDFLARLYRSTREDLLQTGLPENMLNNLIAMQFNAQQASYRNRFPDADYAVIEKDGDAIGCMITHRGNEAIRLVYIALLPHERNQGHGRRLIQALQVEAADTNKVVALSVSTQNTQAQRLYAALEFTVVGNDGAYWEMLWHCQ